MPGNIIKTFRRNILMLTHRFTVRQTFRSNKLLRLCVCHCPCLLPSLALSPSLPLAPFSPSSPFSRHPFSSRSFHFATLNHGDDGSRVSRSIGVDRVTIHRGRMDFATETFVAGAKRSVKSSCNDARSYRRASSLFLLGCASNKTKWLGELKGLHRSLLRSSLRIAPSDRGETRRGVAGKFLPFPFHLLLSPEPCVSLRLLEAGRDRCGPRRRGGDAWNRSVRNLRTRTGVEEEDARPGNYSSEAEPPE